LIVSILSYQVTNKRTIILIILLCPHLPPSSKALPLSLLNPDTKVTLISFSYYKQQSETSNTISWTLWQFTFRSEHHFTCQWKVH